MALRPPRDPWLWAALSAAWVAALVPIWWPRFLPLFDMPQHLAGIALWRRFADPSWHYDDFYTLNLVPVPYWGYYFPVELLARLMPVEMANKVYLSAYAAALPASVIAFGARFGRSPWLAIFAFPLVFNYSFGFGFITYCAAVPLALGTLALLDAFLASPSAARFFLLLLGALATFFTHVLPWLLLGVLAQPFLWAAARRWRRAIAAAAALLPSLVMAIFDFVFAARNRLFNMLEGPVLELEGRHDRLVDTFVLVGHRLIMGWPGAGDALVVAAMAASLLALLLTVPAAARAPRRPREMLPEICLAITLCGYFFLPFHLFKPLDWWNASCRLLTPAALFLVLLVRGPIDGRRRLLMIPALIAALSFPLLLARREVAVNSRLAGLVRLMDRVPRGSSTLALPLGALSDPALDPEYAPYLNVHCYCQFLKGGFDPLQYRNGFPYRLIGSPPPMVPYWLHPEWFNPRDLCRFQFFLTRNESADGQLLGRFAARVPPPARDGNWRLYDTRGLSCGE